MARVISDACVACGTCEGECPVGAISMGDGLRCLRGCLPNRSYQRSLIISTRYLECLSHIGRGIFYFIGNCIL